MAENEFLVDEAVLHADELVLGLRDFPDVARGTTRGVQAGHTALHERDPVHICCFEKIFNCSVTFANISVIRLFEEMGMRKFGKF